MVAHAGQNAVAELAAARAPAVVVADERPFDEQRHTVRALRRGRVAVALDRWPETRRGPGCCTTPWSWAVTAGRGGPTGTVRGGPRRPWRPAPACPRLPGPRRDGQHGAPLAGAR